MIRYTHWLALAVAVFGGSLAAQNPAPADPTKKPATEPAAAKAFNWDDMLMAWVKLSKDFEYSERRIDSYMQVARPETWNEVRNNEFKLKKARVETLDRFKKSVEEFKLDQEFVLGNAAISLGKYDFDLAGFPIENMTDTHYWYTSSARYTEYLPGEFKVFFTNIKPFTMIKMDADKAEMFIKDRTDRFGNINRNAVAVIRFKLVDLKGKRDGEFNAVIQSFTVYHDAKKTRVLAELVPPAKSDK